MTGDDAVVGFLIGSMLMMVIIVIIIGLTFSGTIYISKASANDICFNITEVKGVVGSSDENHNLVCETPSFDSTPHIIIKSNGEG